MKEKIDFRNVAQVVRFELLGSINMPTPTDFENWDVCEMVQLYTRLFDLHHDVCCYLSSSLYLDELNSKYDLINSQVENRNNAADE